MVVGSVAGPLGGEAGARGELRAARHAVRQGRRVDVDVDEVGVRASRSRAVAGEPPLRQIDQRVGPALAEDTSLPSLPVMTIDPAAISVVGVSSGGYMATQLAVAHPALFQGLGVFAAGPWGCAQGELSRAQAEADAEILRKEVDHRVKNSLQTVSSFVRLYRRKVQGEQALEALDAIQRRVDAVSALHEELQFASHVDQVDLQAFGQGVPGRDDITLVVAKAEF